MKKILIVLTALVFTATASNASTFGNWATDTANKINQAETSAAKSIQAKKHCIHTLQQQKRQRLNLVR